MNTVMRIDNQNDMFFVALRRDLATGHAQLVSINKTATFRLSDYDISEYLFPDYRYTGPMQNNMIKPMQNMLKQAEGYPDRYGRDARFGQAARTALSAADWRTNDAPF
jgi:hypothetical protein